MNIDVIFGTNSSGTAEAARAITHILAETGHAVRLRSANETPPASVGAADLTILGSCTWERFEGKKRLDGQLQAHMHQLVEALRRRRLAGRNFAVFGLGDSSYTKFCNAASILEKFVRDAGGRQIGPTLRIDSWFFNHTANRRAAAGWAASLNRMLSSK